jgi:hypothetical protein
MPDYMFLLESRLSAEQRAAVLRMQELAIATESNLYLTGGAVRDLISGMPIRDLDFVTEENPSRLAPETWRPVCPRRAMKSMRGRACGRRRAGPR